MSPAGRIIAGRVLTYTVLGLWSVVCVFPLYWLAMTSIKGAADIDKPPTYLPLVDFRPSLASWDFILSDPYETLVPSLFNSVVVAIASTLLTLTVSVFALYGLTRFRAAIRWLPLSMLMLAGMALSALSIAGNGSIAALLVLSAGLLALLSRAVRATGPVVGPFGAIGLMLATRCLPPVVLAMPLFFMTRWLHLHDSVPGLVLVYCAVNLPVALWLLQPVIGLKATEEEESALLEGATHATVLVEILLPTIRRAVAASGVLVFILCWNEYLLAAYLTSSAAETLPIWMAEQLSMKEAQTGGGAEEWGHMAAAAILMAVPAFVLAAFGIGAVGAATARGRR